LKSEYAGHVTGTNSHLEQAGGQEGHARLKERKKMEHDHEVGDERYYSDCPACRLEQAAPALLADCKAVRQCLELIDNGDGRITSGCVYQQLVADIALAEKGTL